MKRVGLLIIALVFLGMGSLFANTQPNSTKKLTLQISKILMGNSIPDEIKGSVAEVRLAIDSFGEIQVLSISTSNQNLENFLRDNIEGNSVRLGSFKPGKIYRIPILVSRKSIK